MEFVHHRQIHWLVIGILTLGALESIYALVQLAAAQPYILWWRKTVYENVATGTFINRNHLADFLALIVCLGVGYLWTLIKDDQEKSSPNKQAWVYRVGAPYRFPGDPGDYFIIGLGLDDGRFGDHRFPRWDLGLIGRSDLHGGIAS